MQNPNHIHRKDLDQSIMNWLADHSSTILLIAAIASFAITGIIEFFHYKEVFGEAVGFELNIAIAVLFALFFQGVRCATIANSAKQFRNGERTRGIFILFVSLGVTVFCAYEAKQIADIWEQGRPEIAGYIHAGILCVVIAGWVLELILVISVAGKGGNAPSSQYIERLQSDIAILQTQLKETQKAYQILEKQVPISMNDLMTGNGATR